MWTLKDKAVQRLTAKEVADQKLPVGMQLRLKLSMAFTDGTTDIALSTMVSSRDEVKATINQNLARLNEGHLDK